MLNKNKKKNISDRRSSGWKPPAPEATKYRQMSSFYRPKCNPRRLMQTAATFQSSLTRNLIRKRASQ